jgi:hypothetical protein
MVADGSGLHLVSPGVLGSSMCGSIAHGGGQCWLVVACLVTRSATAGGGPIIRSVTAMVCMMVAGSGAPLQCSFHSSPVSGLLRSLGTGLPGKSQGSCRALLTLCLHTAQDSWFDLLGKCICQWLTLVGSHWLAWGSARPVCCL